MGEDIVQSPNKYRETEGINVIRRKEFLILRLLEHGLRSKDILIFQKAQQRNRPRKSKRRMKELSSRTESVATRRHTFSGMYIHINVLNIISLWMS